MVTSVVRLASFRQDDESSPSAFDAFAAPDSARSRGLGGFFFDVDFHLGGDVAKHLDGYRIFAEGFERIGDLHLTLVDFETVSREASGDVRGGNRAEHLIVLTG